MTVLLLCGITACDSSTGSVAGSGPAPAGVVTSTAPSSRSVSPDLGAAEEVARGIEVPWGLAFLPGGDALIAERDSARILRVTPGAGDPEQITQIPVVVPTGEGGLLGLAVSPGFERDNLVYAYFTAATTIASSGSGSTAGQPR